MGETLDKASSEDQFQYWLANMDDTLEDFLARLPAEVCEHLDGSPVSLDVLEAWLLHGIPEVSFLEKKDTPVAPMSLVTASLDRRTGKYLSLVFNGSKELIERNRPRR